MLLNVLLVERVFFFPEETSTNIIKLFSGEEFDQI